MAENGADGQSAESNAAILPGEATSPEGAASEAGFSESRSPARSSLAGSLMSALRRANTTNPARVTDPGETTAALARPARKTTRRLAGALLSPFARRTMTEKNGGPMQREEGVDVEDGVALGQESDIRQRLRSPLHGIAGAVQAAFRSLSPPRTADSAVERIDETGGRQSAEAHRFMIPEPLGLAYESVCLVRSWDGGLLRSKRSTITSCG